MASKKKVYKLENIIPLLSDDQLQVASGMIEDARFMEEQLSALRERIRVEGVDESYQYGSKQTAAMTTYLQVQKQYGVIIRYLTDLIPKSEKTAASENLLEWVSSH